MKVIQIEETEIFLEDKGEGKGKITISNTYGLNVSRNNYPKWDRKLFKDKESLIKYLEEGK